MVVTRSYALRFPRARYLAPLAVALLVAGAFVTKGPHVEPTALRGLLGVQPLETSRQPTVFLLGGSAARDCIVGDADWTRQLRSLADHRLRAYDLGSSNETFDQDIGLVDAMPGGPTLVLIGVSVGRYTHAAADTKPPLGLLSQTAEVWHPQILRHPLSPGRKRQLAREWVSKSWPLFLANYHYNASRLERLVAVCQRRGFHVALVELPLDLSLSDPICDRARQRMLRDVSRLSRRGIPFVRLVDGLELPSADFWDLSHLVRRGAQAWQNRLSAETVALLRDGLLP
jgi:hypothetical protein